MNEDFNVHLELSKREREILYCAFDKDRICNERCMACERGYGRVDQYGNKTGSIFCKRGNFVKVIICE